MSIRAVIFDLGGVIVRTEDRGPREQLAARSGLTYEQLSDLIFSSLTAQLATIGKISIDEHWEYVCTTLKAPPEELGSIKDLFWAGDRVDSALVDAIRSLRPRYQTGLLSNAWITLREALRDEWRIIDAFDVVIISAEAGMAKPDPRIFQLAVDQMKVRPDEAVFVDDFVENIEAAAKMGLRTVRFLNSAQALADLQTILEE
ncbi:MAG: HAD family phosphatase [Chloroflexota bacterium]|nr:MAG: HAD family phosphatase [Chloroflexota bacterium]